MRRPSLNAAEAKHNRTRGPSSSAQARSAASQQLVVPEAPAGRAAATHSVAALAQRHAMRAALRQAEEEVGALRQGCGRVADGCGKWPTAAAPKTDASPGGSSSKGEDDDEFESELKAERQRERHQRADANALADVANGSSAAGAKRRLDGGDRLARGSLGGAQPSCRPSGCPRRPRRSRRCTAAPSCCRRWRRKQRRKKPRRRPRGAPKHLPGPRAAAAAAAAHARTEGSRRPTPTTTEPVTTTAAAIVAVAAATALPSRPSAAAVGA